MIISVLKEAAPETRVAFSPTTVKQLVKEGFQVHIQQHAGLAAGFSDDSYEKAGAKVIRSKKTILKDTHILVSVAEPELKDLSYLPAKALLIGPFDEDEKSKILKKSLEKKLTVLSMNLIPRISRAQGMDSLSSQANLAGYRAVLEAVTHYKRAIPMMMTAAGMIHPAKVLILGAGVAGLQAIATARRLGAVVYAFDVRKAAKEQVESLGAEFIAVSEEDSETKGGYAGETSEAYKKQQALLIDDYAKKADIIISTALIPGKKAPLLLHKSTVESMKPGSVIVDLATSRGGNCDLSVLDKIIDHQGITIIGIGNMAGLVATTASELYGNNLLQILKLIAPSANEICCNPEDEIIQQSILCSEGKYLPFLPLKELQNA